MILFKDFAVAGLIVSLSTSLNFLFIPSSQAVVTFTGEEVGNDVVFTWTGQINLTGLGSPTSANFSNGIILVRPTGINGYGFGKGSVGGDRYEGAIINAPDFALPGAPFQTDGDSGSGDDMGIFSDPGFPIDNAIYLPEGYLSNAPISGSGTFLNNTFLGLGIDASQSYTFSLSNGDEIILQFQPVPEPLTLLGASAAIAFGATFKRKTKA
ncbi:MAG: PEP-CTERM sorting domain-containing protein [Merismopediaceae bacterium]|nr:PEP-CTERM sorting domain-containing protein [Merismopediaceae bacterium]